MSKGPRAQMSKTGVFMYVCFLKPFWPDTFINIVDFLPLCLICVNVHVLCTQKAVTGFMGRFLLSFRSRYSGGSCNIARLSLRYLTWGERVDNNIR